MVTANKESIYCRVSNRKGEELETKKCIFPIWKGKERQDHSSLFSSPMSFVRSQQASAEWASPSVSLQLSKLPVRESLGRRTAASMACTLPVTPYADTLTESLFPCNTENRVGTEKSARHCL